MIRVNGMKFESVDEFMQNLEKGVNESGQERPAYYRIGATEPKDAIRDWGLNFNLGNVVKYVVRAGRKGDAIEDLKKARTYLDFEIEALLREDKADDKGID